MLYGVLVSDFKSSKNSGSDANSSKVDSNLLPFVGLQNSCYFKSPFRKLNKEEELIIEIQNHSNENRKNVLLDLFINNKKRGFLNIDIDSQSVIKKTIPFTNLEPGNINGKVQIETFLIGSAMGGYWLSPKIRSLSGSFA